MLVGCRLDDDLYAQSTALLGDRGILDFAVAVSFYSFVAFTLNTFDIGPMPGLDRYWPD